MKGGGGGCGVGTARREGGKERGRLGGMLPPSAQINNVFRCACGVPATLSSRARTVLRPPHHSIFELTARAEIL